MTHICNNFVSFLLNGDGTTSKTLMVSYLVRFQNVARFILIPEQFSMHHVSVLCLKIKKKFLCFVSHSKKNRIMSLIPTSKRSFYVMSLIPTLRRSVHIMSLIPISKRSFCMVSLIPTSKRSFPIMCLIPTSKEVSVFCL